MRFKRFFCAVLALLSLLAALPAQAETRQAYVSANTMPVYKLPNLLSQELGVMSYGEGVKALAVKGKWVQIKNSKGKIGYCEKSALTTKNPNNLDVDGWVREGGAFIFAKPGVGYKHIATVSAGTRLNAVAITKDKKWVRVKNGKHYGYIPADDLSKSPTTGGSAKKIWIVSNEAVNVSRAKDKNDAALGIVSQGQSYQLIKTEGSHAYIRNGKGQQGWIPKSAVSTKDPNNLNKTRYAQASGKFLYSNAVLKDAKASLSKNDKVTVVSVTENGRWSRVRKGKHYYYAPSILLGDARAPEEGTLLKCTADKLNVYADAKLSGDISASLKKGDTVRLIGVSGNALKVKTNADVVGYCKLSDMKTA